MMSQHQTDFKRPQIKICGLTTPGEAAACAALGADAIGCIFYPKSPRHITEKQAKNIAEVLPPEIPLIGVFVNAGFDEIMKKVEACRLKGVQLHGWEPPDLTSRLMNEHLLVIKALFDEKEPNFSSASYYKVSALLAECGRGKLPGGNAWSWDWGKAKSLGRHYPLILAGGLSAENIRHAVDACFPDAVDISSGVESAPGKKDPEKVKTFIRRILTCVDGKNEENEKPRRIFNAGQPNQP